MRFPKKQLEDSEIIEQLEKFFAPELVEEVAKETGFVKKKAVYKALISCAYVYLAAVHLVSY